MLLKSLFLSFLQLSTLLLEGSALDDVFRRNVHSLVASTLDLGISKGFFYIIPSNTSIITRDHLFSLERDLLVTIGRGSSSGALDGSVPIGTRAPETLGKEMSASLGGMSFVARVERLVLPSTMATADWYFASSYVFPRLERRVSTC